MVKRLKESISVRDVLDFDILQLLKECTRDEYGVVGGVFVSELSQVINDRFTEDEYLKAAKFYSDLFDVYETKYGYFGDHDHLILQADKNIELFINQINKRDFTDINDADEGDLLTVSDFRKIS